jgi:hypothetical protein
MVYLRKYTFVIPCLLKLQNKEVMFRCYLGSFERYVSGYKVLVFPFNLLQIICSSIVAA